MFLQRSHTNGQHIYEQLLSITHGQEDANESHNENLTPVKMAMIKKTKDSKYGEDVERLESPLLVGM